MVKDIGYYFIPKECDFEEGHKSTYLQYYIRCVCVHYNQAGLNNTFDYILSHGMV